MNRLKILIALSVLAALPACGWFASLRDGTQGAWTCSNVSPLGQQYMRAETPEALNCGTGGTPVRVGAAG